MMRNIKWQFYDTMIEIPDLKKYLHPMFIWATIFSMLILNIFLIFTTSILHN